jgi:hypothetical protein
MKNTDPNVMLRHAKKISGLSGNDFSRELQFELKRQGMNVSTHAILAWLKPDESKSSRKTSRLVARVAESRWHE